MLKAIKIRICPSREQEIYISKLLGSCRFVYNNLLSYKIEKYNIDKHNVTFKELNKKLTELKTIEEFIWLKESHSKVLQQSMINLDLAYKSFFKNGTGFPKFKSRKNNKQSCRFPVDAIGNLKGNKITIIKDLKNIHFKCSKTDEKYLNKNQNSIRSGTLTKTKSGNYYFSILIDKPNTKILSKSDKIVGIDLGIKDFIVCSNGNKFENIKIIRNNEDKLSKLHRNLSRKTGIKNKEKSRIKLAKFNEKLNNIKENYLHLVTNKLLDENQVIVMEDLNVLGMMKNHNLARSIQELSLNRFKTILEYKANWYNRDVIQVDRFFPSSKLCSSCGFKNDKLELKDREWICPKCGKNNDRDFNASLNIEREGIRILQIGSSSPKLTPLEKIN